MKDITKLKDRDVVVSSIRELKEAIDLIGASRSYRGMFKHEFHCCKIALGFCTVDPGFSDEGFNYYKNMIEEHIKKEGNWHEEVFIKTGPYKNLDTTYPHNGHWTLFCYKGKYYYDSVFHYNKNKVKQWKYHGHSAKSVEELVGLLEKDEAFASFIMEKGEDNY